ncbi:Rieske [2Fe-2S] iron-sulfur domain-containing protein [Fusarium redolens]|uniref:Rieske [2Fe-2S] iron-sulfur domain-containing protein n=1 Tax=Fusarium redolens TaxID=48865 RepID=A0A9P9HPZ4_FUSRE|nr:Rieske [2Fe-2S] iron-sulfur domain-containing protein [Fusarium redolens]KAH7260677.1 Rieske [2Fe-2S] iron-sulfur domain-containing protein [Fusarium redolens]
MLTLGALFFFAIAAAIALIAKKTLSKPQKENLISRAIPAAAPLTQPLPSTWYKSDDIYELERRAIFSKKWILLTHKMRFDQTGAWVRYAEAGFDFFLIRNAEGTIRGFHNICRHRAFPVVVKDNGQNNVLSCKYHGWSYGMNGQLAKAPLYQDLPGFDRSKNGLFPLHTHVDAKGFVWINMDAKAVPENPWSEDLSQSANHGSFNFDDYKFDHVKQDSSSFNWKTLADKSCTGSNIDSFENAAEKKSVVNDFFFPNASMTISPHFFFLLRCVPTSATKSQLQYEVYRHKSASESDFKKVEDILQQKASEQEAPAEKNLRAGVLVDQTPLQFQNQVYQLVEHHRKLEGVAGREIRPAQQILDKSATKTEQDESLFSSCSGLSCGKIAKDLSW